MSTPIPVPPVAESAVAQKTPVNVRSKDEASLAPFNPSCDQAQFTSLEILHLTSNDVLFDLGCGDGRMLINAAQRVPGLRCVGIELDRVFVKRGHEALQKLPPSVQSRVDIRQGDLLQAMGESLQSIPGSETLRDGDDDESIMGRDCRNLSLFKDATAVYLFLLPKGIQKIQTLLNAVVAKRKLDRKPLHVVAYMFSVREWEPSLVDRTTKGEVPLYLYKFGPDDTAKADTEEDAS